MNKEGPKLALKKFGVGVVGYGLIGKMHTYAYELQSRVPALWLY